jgi:TPR repeat protein
MRRKNEAGDEGRWSAIGVNRLACNRLPGSVTQTVPFFLHALAMKRAHESAGRPYAPPQPADTESTSSSSNPPPDGSRAPGLRSQLPEDNQGSLGLAPRQADACAKPSAPPVLHAAQTGAQTSVHAMPAIQGNSHEASPDDACAQYRLGCMYRDGIGMEQDIGLAFHWISKAADQGWAEAQDNLGDMYFSGIAVTKDLSLAFQWFSKAAEQNLAAAQHHLGNMYLCGMGTAKDLSLAFHWFSKAAEQGLTKAQHSLGIMYCEGMGTAKDLSLAFQWLSKAADKGWARAQNRLGIMYFNGMGMAKDLSLTFQWFSKAADQGEAMAQRNLGRMYRDGFAVSQDHAKAMEWFLLAAGWNKPGITELMFRMDDINDATLRHLPTAMQGNTAITAIKLSACRIGDEGAIHIASLIGQDATLKSIDLTGNPIGIKGMQALAQAMKGNTTLQVLEVPDLNGEANAVIRQHCERNRNITQLTHRSPPLSALASSYELPSEVVSIVDHQLILADQKLGTDIVSPEATQQRLLESWLCLQHDPQSEARKPARHTPAQ